MTCRNNVMRGCLAVAMLALSSSLLAQAVGPIGIPPDPNVQRLAQLANPPDGHVDYAQVQEAIERMANPSFDTAAFDAELNHWVTVIQKRLPAHAQPTQVMTAMGEVIYTPGPWNDQHPFSYDLSDPLAKNNGRRFVSTYLRTRKGNCVSMPTLLVILGQKLGLTMTLAQAPGHEFARLQDTNGRWINIEATTPNSWTDDQYIKMLHVTPRSMESGIYMRTLTPRETVSAMLDPLLGVYARTRPSGYLLGLARLTQQLDPMNADGYVMEGNAYFLELSRRYLVHHLRPEKLPPAERDDFNALYQSDNAVMARVEAMGWEPPTAAQDKAYLQRIQRYKTTHGG